MFTYSVYTPDDIHKTNEKLKWPMFDCYINWTFTLSQIAFPQIILQNQKKTSWEQQNKYLIKLCISGSKMTYAVLVKEVGEE